MSYGYEYAMTAAQAPADARAAFIRRTYGHLAGAVLAFAGLEYVLLSLPGIDKFIMAMFGSGMIVMLVMVGLFIGVSYLAQTWAQSSTSIGMQYAGLGLYVVVEAVIFLPLLYIADRNFPGVIQSAGIMTLAVFGGLTAAVLITRKDFSFLGPVLAIAGLVAFAAVLAAVVVGFQMGVLFSFLMVALACGYILYDTSNVLHHYRTDQHVAAALALFASVALLFYYILRIAMASSRD